MQEKFREKIMSHWLDLVTKIDPFILAESLQTQTKVFSLEEFETVFEDKTDIKHITRLLLFLIQKKDDATYHLFVDLLEEFNLKHLFKDPNINYEIRSKVCQEPDQPDSQIAEPSLIDNAINSNINTVILAEDFACRDTSIAYETFSRNRGHVLIINNKKNNIDEAKIRTGSEIDLNNLKELFEQMYLKVFTHQDLRVNEMQKQIRSYTKSFDSIDRDKLPDLCIVIIMSHGEENNGELTILDQDEKPLSTAWIEEQFNNINFSIMHGKPKIFIYQCCRGHLYDNVILNKKKETKSEDKVETDGAFIKRRVDDTLVCYATQSGYKAHRNTLSGSWYIQEICKVFREHAHNTTFRSMLDKVDRNLKNFYSEHITSRDRKSVV